MPCLVAGSKPASQLFLNINRQTCETPVHGKLKIGNVGYGLYPSDTNSYLHLGVVAAPGVIITPDNLDPKKEQCEEIELDDSSYDIDTFKSCVRRKVEADVQDPPG